MFKVKIASGCNLLPQKGLKENRLYEICHFGAGVEKSPLVNTNSINRAICKAAEEGGGTVLIPKGEFKTYTIQLKSHVNIKFEKGSILKAAKTEIRHSYELQETEGGNYLEPEVNPYVGLQDHGHTYFANSLIYGCEIEDVMIYGEGLINGSTLNEEGEFEHVLMGGDPLDPIRRSENGHKGEWFGNKAIALDRCKDIVLTDFSILAGGHFAIIATCVKNMYVENIIVDTNRDAFDVDCCQDVTIRHSVFNSLTDDAIVMKASYGGGIFMPLKNVLIEDCTVYGYDLGSVLNKTYTAEKLVATDRCGPTARVKLGTESTCGYDQVTVRRVHFERSRGFALEAVDGANLSNILFEDSTMTNISSSPIFIKAGDRGRFPVTGILSDDTILGQTESVNVRLDQKQWILPNTDDYQVYPAKRFWPSYNRSKAICLDGYHEFDIIDTEEPYRLNSVNYHFEDGRYFKKIYDEQSKKYMPDYDKEIDEKDCCLYGNAIGSPILAKVSNVIIRNIRVDNVDPRYPVELMGMMDQPLENILLENIKISYRGGMDMSHAVEQRQINTNWDYIQQGKSKRLVQSIPWLVNTFFLKNEGLLPRVSWNIENSTWKDDPFNVPELTEVYPEPSNWGILPAYGTYGRHVKNLILKDIAIKVDVKDERYPIVLDDIEGGMIESIDIESNKATIAFVKNNYKRPTGLEYIKDFPYITTEVKKIDLDKRLIIDDIIVNAPAPGTPKDGLYRNETIPCQATGYTYSIDNDAYRLPETVYRPFFKPIRDLEVKVCESLTFEILLRQPAYEVSTMETDGKIYNETLAKKDHSVPGIEKPMKLEIQGLPEDIYLDLDNFIPGVPILVKWIPDEKYIGSHEITCYGKDDIGLVDISFKINVHA